MMAELARKTNLGRNLKRMKKLFPAEYDIFPMTYILPAEYDVLMSQRKPKQFYIVKPECGSQGRGIYLTTTLNEVAEKKENRCVVQHYLSRPLLIDGYKFDLRIYVLITCVEPLSVFIYKEGLARFCTEEYKRPSAGNMEQMFMHLTNYAINKGNDNFEAAEDTDGDSGFKRSLTSVLDKLATMGYPKEEMWRSIEDCCVKTIIAGVPGLAHMFKAVFRKSIGFNCFEVLGFDIMLDDTGKPWMIEVNNLPSFETETSLDAHIKRNLLRDTLTLVGGDNPARKLFVKQKYERAQARIYGDSNHVGSLKREAVKAAQEEKKNGQGGYKGRKEEMQAREKAKQREAELVRKKELKEAAKQERTQMQKNQFDYEDANLGNYFRAYPVKDDRYDAYTATWSNGHGAMAETKTLKMRREEINRSRMAKGSDRGQ